METVHLWRGTDEQKAQRFTSKKTGQFAYFDQQLGHPDWQHKKVLDFGGNTGDLLRDPTCKIEPQNYYCVDVILDALKQGEKLNPEANWHHFNCYNCSFNPEGEVGAKLPEMGVKFDYILAYSVFTHVSLQEMHDLIRQLQSLLSSGGVLAFTFIDPHYISWPDTELGNNLQWRLDRCFKDNSDINVSDLLAQSLGANWCSLVDYNQLYVNSDGEYDDDPDGCLPYNVYHTVKFMQQQFPDATMQRPVNGEMQHCCVMHN